MYAKNNIKIRQDLDRAIEEGNMEDIKNMLERIPDCTPPMSAGELADSIMSDDKEVRPMKNKIPARVLLVASVIAVIACASVSAGSLLKHYVFEKDGYYVKVETNNSNLSEDEANKLAEERLKASKETEPSEENILKPQTFATVEEAEKALDMDIVMPKHMPGLELKEISGAKTHLSEKSSKSSVWLTYGDTESKAFGLTVTKADYNDEYVEGTLITDSKVTGEEFVTDKGIKYDILTDTDETGEKTAYIYVTNAGRYEYAMDFYGFDKTEMESIVNSADISEYLK